MSNYGESIISKAIQDNDPNVFSRFNLSENDFVTDVEIQAYQFIRSYSMENRGQAPSFEAVTAEVEGFNFRPDITDSFEYMVKKLKNYQTQLRMMDLLQVQATQKFSSMEGIDFAQWLETNVQSVIEKANYRTKVGTDLALDTGDYLAEYKARKDGTSFKVWNSAFPSMNTAIGGYLSGNMYTWYGRSGRGKSVFCMIEAIEAALQGATVLIWAMEMSKYEWLSRAYSYISAKQQIVNAEVEGKHYLAGFNTGELLRGTMTSEFEAGFEDFLRNLNTILKGKIIIRAVDDGDFFNRTARQLEADILQVKADVVVVDPIYYMDFERNSSNVAGGDVAATSKAIRRLSGSTKATIHVITQAEETKDDKDEDGERVLKAPTRAEIKKTKAVLEDATNTFGIDSADGRFIIEIGKGRNGGEGTKIEGTYLPAVGYVKEFTLSDSAKQFNF